MGVLYKIKLDLGGVRAPPLLTPGVGWGLGVKHNPNIIEKDF